MARRKTAEVHKVCALADVWKMPLIERDNKCARVSVRKRRYGMIDLVLISGRISTDVPWKECALK